MAYNVIWSAEAEISYINVVDDLLFRWTEREVAKFITRTEEVISKISEHPYLYRAYHKVPSIRHGILHKNTTMFYKGYGRKQNNQNHAFLAFKNKPQ